MTIYDETPASRDVAPTISDEYPNCNADVQECREDTGSQPAENKPVSPGEPPGTLYRAAGFWIRLLAFALDLGVIACLNAIIWDAVLPRQLFIYKIIHTNALFLGLTGLAYFILMTYYFQQTLGKMITGIQVIQRSGDPLSWTTVVFRELVGRSLSQLMGLNLGYLWCWFNGDKRCWHDYLSDTWVVYVNPQSHTGYIAVDGHLV